MYWRCSISRSLDIAAANSPVHILVIAAREDLVILREVRRLMGWQ